MFQDLYDGFKNYLTVRAYVSPDNESYLLYQQMNYPMGDYIFYTDNSPLISVPLKALNHMIGDFSASSIGIYSAIWLVLLWLSPLVLYRVFCELDYEHPITAIASLILVWVNPQMDRFNIGHYNLTAVILFLFLLLILVRWYKALKAEDLLRRNWSYVHLILLVVCSSFIHLYYLPLLLLFYGLTVFL